MEIDNFDIKDADMVRDIKRAFASEHKLCPDVEDELSLFWERQHEKKKQHLRWFAGQRLRAEEVRQQQI